MKNKRPQQLSSPTISPFTPLMLATALVFSVPLSAYASAENTSPSPVTATSANEFLNSIGANTAVSRRGERLKQTRNALDYTGVRWIRTGYETNAPLADLLSLHKDTGVKFSYGLLSGGTDIARLIKDGKQLAAQDALLALEGVNEPNNWGIKYQEQKGAGQAHSWLPVAKLQKDLYQAVKSDPDLADIPVWHISENGAQSDNAGLQYLEIPEGADALLPAGTKYADFANVHNYIIHPKNPHLADNQTWSAADPGPHSRVSSLYEHYGKTWFRSFPGYDEQALSSLPRVTTETGLRIEGEINEEKHARLIVNMYLAQFKRGWSYTALYLLRDRVDEGGNQKFGLYKPDYSPRKAADYLHNLTHILADKKHSSPLSSLAYELPNQPKTVHDLLLQKSDGTFELVVWGEKVSGSEEVVVKFAKAQEKVRIYDITKGTMAVKTLSNTETVKLTLSDYPMIIEIL
ncbi:glycosyl hydrolase [Oceanisphaera avium]|uniref:Glycosyl hydrolase n=1 Tax=Oceanisphaera avium TaxID=1903694 RepID=A0A1Y0CZ70_9GAMM|nr:glycosyl hydrolase [Oceanisphaera avium]ART80612.1 glycosyl hydrolase [Oceanisphaera avium]